MKTTLTAEQAIKIVEAVRDVLYRNFTYASCLIHAENGPILAENDELVEALDPEKEFEVEMLETIAALLDEAGLVPESEQAIAPLTLTGTASDFLAEYLRRCGFNQPIDSAIAVVNEALAKAEANLGQECTCAVFNPLPSEIKGHSDRCRDCGGYLREEKRQSTRRK